MGSEYLLYLFERDGYLILGVGSHKAETYQSVVRSDGRRDYRIDENAFVLQIAGDGERLEIVTDIEWYDGGRGVADLTAHVAEAFKRVIGDLPEMLLTLGLGLHDLHCLESCCRRCGRDAGGEDL